MFDLTGKVALITGADSGIGRAVAVAFALEGAKVAVLYNENDGDAETTKRMVEERGGACLLIQADVRDPDACGEAVERTVREFGGLNVLVNNAAYQKVQQSVLDISDEQFRRTLETNLFGYFYMIKAALPHLKGGDAIINTGSIVGETGNQELLDYTASKGGIHALTRSLALQLGPRNIRVNAVLPGPLCSAIVPPWARTTAATMAAAP